MSKKEHIVTIETHAELADGEEYLSKAISDAVTENELRFYERMKFISSQVNGLADPFEGSLEINEVRIDNSGNGQLDIQWEWEVYNPCEGLHKRSDSDDTWGFKIDGTKIIFDLTTPEREDEI